MAYDEQDDNGKEYYKYKLLSERITSLKLFLDEKEKMLKMEIAYMEKARELQAKEYERRLHELNNEKARIEKNQAESVARVMFDEYVKNHENEQSIYKDTIAKEIGEIKNRLGTTVTLRQLWLAAVAILGLAIGAAKLFFTKKNE